ncbi:MULTISPECIES: hypothetical protein [Aliiglaciecola]|uniref:hypothetical protein n=1 Tax=Aliiglaciecola TaxID=1406885 RepID=UPI001C08F9E8|nr:MULTISPECIES: hypothetical protein [Aliiglaciecola]MBU2878735.1 hypothetical protein [Aliiglaciecola lipolytica]MDO6711368.1 hypothetical protein [Aliiglaciecola sp. 2_MG-2023]MDO6752183.1 hypothetical protein [Aliiglaciecola sp. 1_MG-2023]
MKEAICLLFKWCRVNLILVLTIFVFVTSLSLTLVAYQYTVDMVATKKQKIFQQKTTNILDLVQERFATYEQVLHGVRGLFVGSEK